MPHQRDPKVWLIAASLLFAMTIPCLAQNGFPHPDGLTATGKNTIKLTPTFLEMSIQIEGSSSKLTQAAEELAERIEIAKKKLEELDAIADSVSVSSAKLKSSGGGDSEAAMMQQMMAQYGGGRRGKAMLESTQSVSVVQSIVARWALPESESTERLIDIESLLNKIKDADVGSTNRDQPMSPAQEELAAEMEAMADQYSYDETPKVKPGTPSFSYVAVLDDDTHGQAIGSAFSDAKSTITLLAKSTSQAIGTIRPQSMEVNSGTSGSYGRYNPYGNPVAAGPIRNPDTGLMEIAANDPSEAEVTVSVNAIASIKSDD